MFEMKVLEQLNEMTNWEAGHAARKRASALADVTAEVQRILIESGTGSAVDTYTVKAVLTALISFQSGTTMINAAKTAYRKAEMGGRDRW